MYKSKIANIYWNIRIEFTGMNTSKTILASCAIVIAFALIVAPLAISQNALAGGNHHHHHKDKKGNFAQQIIAQSQKSSQNSQVVSGGSTSGSGNNINLQFQSNSGNNALAQD